MRQAEISLMLILEHRCATGMLELSTGILGMTQKNIGRSTQLEASTR